MHVTAVIGPLGPVIIAQVGVTVARGRAMVAAGQTVPALVPVGMLVDTGASSCSLDTSVIAQLGLTPTGSTQLHTPSTGTNPHNVNLYDVAMLVTNNAGHHHLVEAIPVMECDFSAQGIGGLLGRDFLAAAHLTYSGPQNSILISF